MKIVPAWPSAATSPRKIRTAWEPVSPGTDQPPARHESQQVPVAAPALSFKSFKEPAQARTNTIPLLVATCSHQLLDGGKLSWRGCCGSAFRTVRLILVGSFVSVVGAWVAALCLCSGNLFSGQRPENQSRRTFLIGILLWCHVLFCASAWIARSVSLFQHELISHPGRPAGAAWCLGRMFRGTILWFVFCGMVVCGIGYGVGNSGPRWRQYRLELYLSALMYYAYVTGADFVARHIYRHETISGSQRRLQQLRITGGSQAPMSSVVIQSGHSTSWLGSARQFLVLSRRNVWLLLALFVSTLYVHLVSSLGTFASKWSVWIFTGVSVALKVAMQEAAKFFIVRRNIHNSRTMAIMVAVPTVLVYTQVRIMFLRFQSTQMTLSTTFGMAAAEIWVRLFKSFWIRRQIRRRRQQMQAHTVGAATSHSKEAEEAEFLVWKAQLHRHHTTELIADMYAEYLAIGCSSVITLVMGTHPQFLLGASSANSASAVVYWQLLLQSSVQAAVDYVCCVMEIASGLSFDSANRERGFYLILFVLLAVVNVDLTAILYMAY